MRPDNVPRAIFSLVLFLLPAATSFLGAQESGTDGPGKKAQPRSIEEYCKRVREISPTSLEGLHALGLWCREGGLEKQAVQVFEDIIAIDSDHAGARRALGHVRYGSGWKRGMERRVASGGASGSRSRNGPRASDRAGGSGRPPTGNKVSGGVQGKETPAGRSSAGAPASGAGGGDAGEGEVAEATTIEEEEILRKKEWAKQVEKVFKSKFVNVETDDFLVHATYSSTRDPQIRSLRNYLKSLKKTLASFLGLKTRGSKFWPGKLQFVLVRSREEYERFADAIDGIKDAMNPEGAYVSEQGHLVLWKPTSEVVAGHLAQTLFDNLNGSNRWVGWWLREGSAELFTALILEKLPGGKERDLYRKRFMEAATYLEAEGENLSIYSLIETPSYRRRERERSRALAMTLVELLQSKKRHGFRGLIGKLKSEEAPAPPSSDSEEEFKSFHLSYLAYQQEVLEASFGELSKLNLLWKDHVRRTVARLERGSNKRGSRKK